ncbi:MAG: esterase [Planctomycetia bacterium]|nr:esterase [Planctomycetia bacterium]
MTDLLAGWTREIVDGHPCEFFEPPAPSEHAYVVLYLHGVHLATLGGNEVYTREFARHGLRAIVPMTRRSWWADRICPEFDATITAQQYVLDRVLPVVQKRWGATPPRVALLGTSMGGQGALRFSFKFPDRFPIVAALSPAIDYQLRFYEDEDDPLPMMYDSPETARQDTATLHVHPLNWPRHIWFCCDPADHRWHESAERLRSKLAALGIPYECDLTSEAGGHGWTYYNDMAPRAVGFLMECLERERLRIV